MTFRSLQQPVKASPVTYKHHHSHQNYHKHTTISTSNPISTRTLSTTTITTITYTTTGTIPDGNQECQIGLPVYNGCYPHKHLTKHHQVNNHHNTTITSTANSITANSCVRSWEIPSSSNMQKFWESLETWLGIMRFGSVPAFSTFFPAFPICTKFLGKVGKAWKNWENF